MLPADIFNLLNWLEEEDKRRHEEEQIAHFASLQMQMARLYIEHLGAVVGNDKLTKTGRNILTPGIEYKGLPL